MFSPVGLAIVPSLDSYDQVKRGEEAALFLLSKRRIVTRRKIFRRSVSDMFPNGAA